jgi:hypothetical protein
LNAFKSNDAAAKAGFYVGQGSANMSIADVYSVIGNPTNARIYYEKRLQYYAKQRHYFFGYGATKCGGEYANKDYNNALAYYNESGILFKKLNYEIGTAYNIGNTGCFMQKLVIKSNESD